jgi:hypothetical protein
MSTDRKGKQMNTYYLYRVTLNTRHFEVKANSDIEARDKAKMFLQRGEKMTKITRISDKLSNNHADRAKALRARYGMSDYLANATK